MGKIFDLDSPIMRFLSRMADLMILNLVTLICCIPIITIGASMTALHYVLLKMVRNEEGYIVKAFFKSFKQNFKQATIIWLVVLLFIIIFVVDIFVFNYSGIQFPQVLRVILLALAFFASMTMCYIFPLLSRFENTILQTLKNALLMSILNLPKTLLMMVVYILPMVAWYFSAMAMPIIFLFGISAPAYVAAMLYSGTFKKFEPEEEPVSDRFEIETENESDVTKN